MYNKGTIKTLLPRPLNTNDIVADFGLEMAAGSNFAGEHPDWGFPGFPSISPSKYRDGTLRKVLADNSSILYPILNQPETKMLKCHKYARLNSKPPFCPPDLTNPSFKQRSGDPELNLSQNPFQLSSVKFSKCELFPLTLEETIWTTRASLSMTYAYRKCYQIAFLDEYSTGVGMEFVYHPDILPVGTEKEAWGHHWYAGRYYDLSHY